MIYTFSNFLSLLRGPLALLFIIDHTSYRVFAVIMAMITDYLDGYLARRFQTTSAVGAFLDPVMDKFFVLVAINVLIYEGNLEFWQALTLLSRDFAVLLFGGYLIVKGTWSHFQFRSIWCGKITTTLQFLVLLALIFHISLPLPIFTCFIILGCFAFLELYFIEKQRTAHLL